MSDTAPNARISDIVRQIRGAALNVLPTDVTAKQAREAAQAASMGHTLNREGIMVTLANLSMNNQWSASDVKNAARVAAGLSTKIEAEKSVATFIGEATKAMLPNVRSHVPSLVHIRDLAWDAETLAKAEDTEAPTPLRKAFSRGYHCLMQMMKLAEEGRVIDTVPELLAFAAERDPDLNTERVMKRLAGIRKHLEAFYHDFPVDDIQVCVDALNEITEKQLKACQPTQKPTTVVVVKQPKLHVEPENLEVDDDAEIADQEPEDIFQELGFGSSSVTELVAA